MYIYMHRYENKEADKSIKTCIYINMYIHVCMYIPV